MTDFRPAEISQEVEIKNHVKVFGADRLRLDLGQVYPRRGKGGQKPVKAVRLVGDSDRNRNLVRAFVELHRLGDTQKAGVILRPWSLADFTEQIAAAGSSDSLTNFAAAAVLIYSLGAYSG